MNRDKQIEEMARDIDIVQDYGLATESPPEQWLVFDNKTLAQYLYEKGYRKASDVAREIFEEIERMLTYFPLFGTIESYIVDVRSLAELKKKYTEGEG